MIELKQLTKDYGTTLAVDNLSLRVAAGEIYGFIGPNGAGKTTTIRMMGGIIEPTAGRIMISGIDIHKEPVAAKKIIGFVPDRPFLYEKLTGMEFLKFVGDLYHVDLQHLYRKSEELLKQFSLWDWANEIIEAYSHGMKQRLIIAAALLYLEKTISLTVGQTSFIVAAVIASAVIPTMIAGYRFTPSHLLPATRDTAAEEESPLEEG